MLGSPILYLKGMGIMMFQLSGFYYNPKPSDHRYCGVPQCLSLTPSVQGGRSEPVQISALSGALIGPL